ncbi:undecaprenyldiphospho-muramoylpentapeptide beta-N- acetylglucosaminyltransferase [compost metagenome]
MIVEPDLTGSSLFAAVERILTESSLHRSMSTAAKQLGKPESAHVIVEEMRRLVRNQGKR